MKFHGSSRHCARFPSLSSFLDWLETAKPTSAQKASQESSPDGYFFGSKDFDEALQLARYGWQRGREALGKLAAQAGQYVQEHAAESWELDVAGAFPLVPAYLSGDPLCMFRLEENQEELASPIVHLVVNITAPSNVKKESIYNYGAALLAFVDSLENQGTRVEIDFFCAVKHTTKTKKSPHLALETLVAVKGKDASAHLDLNKFAFCLAHSSFLRRFFFKYLECCPAFPETAFKLDDGYGLAIKPERTLPLMAEMFPGAIPLPMLSASGKQPDCSTLEKAMMVVRKQFEDGKRRVTA